MVASDSVLQRYALAYIKKSGGNSDVKKFLRYFNNTRNLTWNEDTFAEAYKEHTRLNSTNRRNTESRDDQYNAENNGQSTGSQTTHIHVHNNRGLDFWDYLLLSNLFGSHTTVNNITNINYSSNESREDKKKDSEDSRKLLALGIVVQLCVLLSMLVCVFGIAAAEKRLEKKQQ